MSKIDLGDYVLASRWSDHNPMDPWRVGFVVRIIETWQPHTNDTSLRYVIGEQNGTWQDRREYKYAKRITPEFGRDWIDMYS